MSDHELKFARAYLRHHLSPAQWSTYMFLLWLQMKADFHILFLYKGCTETDPVALEPPSG